MKEIENEEDYVNRIRSVKPEIRRNRKIADCGILASLLSRDLITYADDQGRFHASAREVKAECFPYFESLKTTEVERALLALASVGFIELYVATETGTQPYKTPPDEGSKVQKSVPGRTVERFGWMPGWFKHQLLKPDRIEWSELPPPPGFNPATMKPALYARWLDAAGKGELPPDGDGSLAFPQGFQDGTGVEPHVSNLEPERNRSGDAAETFGDILEPRARARMGADQYQTGPDRNLETEGNPPTPLPPVENSPWPPLVLETGLVGRTQLLLDIAQEIMGRPLIVRERDAVLLWAALKRNGEWVPPPEIEECARRKMAELTPNGTPAVSLLWAHSTVMALARQALGDPLDVRRRAAMRRPTAYEARMAAIDARVTDLMSGEDPEELSAGGHFGVLRALPGGAG